MSKKTEWEEKLADIEVTLRSPDGDESWAESISQIEEYDELKSFIQDLLAKEKMELVRQIKQNKEYCSCGKPSTCDWCLKPIKKLLLSPKEGKGAK